VIAFHCRVPGFAGGFFGVDVFFVLSGFLITSILLSEFERSGRLALGSFYLRRFFRLAPPFVVMLAAYLAAAPLIWSEMPTIQHFAHAGLAALYLTDYSMAFWRVPEILRHTWSLSVEEHYYLLWPCIAALTFRLNRERRIIWLVLLFLAVTIWRVVNVPFASDWEELYSRFDTRLSGLMLGGLLAVLLARGAVIKPWVADVLAGSGLVAIVLCIVFVRWRDTAVFTLGLPLVEFAAAAVILAAADRRTWTHCCLSGQPLVFVGLLSYGLYLWHYPIARALPETLTWPETLAVTSAASLALAAASYVLIERPIRQYRRRLRPDTAPQPA
jgi:peptidoglycan/LPS O-acetylase OafA/YrhL